MGKHSSIRQINDVTSMAAKISQFDSDLVLEIEKEPGQFTLFCKTITHSDIANKYKRNGLREGLEKNILYYLTFDEMLEIQKSTGKTFESAKQSNIGVGNAFFHAIGIDPDSDVQFSEVADLYINNRSFKFFTPKYTNEILAKLGKTELPVPDIDWVVSDGAYTQMEVTRAAHGIGCSSDEEFRKLRGNLFLHDSLNFLVKKESSSRFCIYCFGEKNPRFFSLLDSHSPESHSTTEMEIDEKEPSFNACREEIWREDLFKEEANYTPVLDTYFCSITGMTADSECFGSLFKTVHIKKEEDCTEAERFDINNGLVLSANIAQLFENHLITVNSKRELVLCDDLKEDHILAESLGLNNEIMKAVFSEKRMKYLSYHAQTFKQKEKERKAAKA